MDHTGEEFVLHTRYSREYQSAIASSVRFKRMVRRLLTGRSTRMIAGPHYDRITRAMEAARAMRATIANPELLPEQAVHEELS